MSLSSVNSIGKIVFELESGNENVNGQTDIRHINLITMVYHSKNLTFLGRLVTCNPPKNVKFLPW